MADLKDQQSKSIKSSQENSLGPMDEPGETDSGLAAQRVGLFQRAKGSKIIYFSFVIVVAIFAIVLMVLPNELISPAPEDPELDLDTTFGTLVCFCFYYFNIGMLPRNT